MLPIPLRASFARRAPTLVALTVSGIALPAVAQRSADPPTAVPSPGSAAADSTSTLGTVNVQATAAGPLTARSVFSSVDVLGADVLQNQRTDYSWELLSMAPGVQVTQFKHGTDAGHFSFRGFNGEGRVNAVKLLIDGIPSNDNAGGMPFLDAVFPLDIESIEIVRGTNDPRYGLNNIAGNANVRTRTGGNEGRASITAGSFGTQDVHLSKGIESGNWSQNYSVAWRDSDGYRDHADARKVGLSGKWFYTSDDSRWRAGTIARYAYLQAVIRPVRDLKIVPALRIDHVGGTLDDRLAGTTLPSYDYGLIKQPKISVADTLTPQASVYGNWGRTFQIGTGIDGYRSQTRNLAPSLNDGWELGVKLSPRHWLQGRVAHWEQRATGEVARVLGVNGLPDPGGSGNVGRTLRKGIDLQMNARPSASVTAWTAYSHQTARIVAPDPSAPATRGKEIENVPHYLASADIDWQATEAWRLSAWGNAQGDYYVDRTDTLGRLGRYALLDLGATLGMSPTVDVHLQVKNVTDRRHVYAWYDGGSSGYSPADDRGVYASLNVRF